MNCQCPKCFAESQLDHSLIPENGTDRICSSCKARYWVYKESFSGRALRKSGEIYCEQCGEKLDHSVSCRNCGALYPHYFILQTTKMVPKKAPKKRTFVFYDRPAPRKRIKTVLATKKPAKTSAKKSGKVSSQSPRSLKKIAIGLATVAVLAAGVGFFYYQRVVEDRYRSDYVRALYVIKSGTDLDIKTCDKIAGNANSISKSMLSLEDASKLKKVKGEADKLMEKLKKPPKKYAMANDKLVRLYGIYSDLNSNLLDPSGVPTRINASAEKLEDDFTKGVKDLKANLPSDLSQDIKTAQVRYKSLREI